MDSELNPYASPGSPQELPCLWTGWYAYDPSPLVDVELPVVSFSLSLRMGWFGRFTGEVQDGPESPMQEKGVVKGFFRNSKIEFTKRMPIATITLPDGSTQRPGGAHPPIQYYGEFDIHSKKLTGRWYILTNEGAAASGDWEAVPAMDDPKLD